MKNGDRGDDGLPLLSHIPMPATPHVQPQEGDVAVLRNGVEVMITESGIWDAATGGYRYRGLSPALREEEFDSDFIVQLTAHAELSAGQQDFWQQKRCEFELKCCGQESGSRANSIFRLIWVVLVVAALIFYFASRGL